MTALGTGREIVTIHVGQAGVQIGAAMWELFCQEHNIDNQGYTIPGTERNFEKVENIFYETSDQKYVPRCVQVDLEPTVMDEIRSGIYRDLYTPSSLINSCPDAANNFARGALTNGLTVLEQLLQAVRKLTNLCDNVSTFKIVHSFTGGTGSGLTSKLVEQLSDIYGKKFKFGVGVYPSTKFSHSMVDPYNTLLLTNATLDHMDCVCVFDNESLYNIMANMLGVEGPHFIHINRMMAQMVSSLTLAHRFRFSDSKHSDLDELLTNLVPFPRIHFPLVSYAPLLNWDEHAHSGFSVGELTDACFLPENQTMNVDVLSQKYFSCAMLYRGCMSSKEIYDSLNRVKTYKHIQFVDWCPTGFKVALNMCKPFVNVSSELAAGDRAVCMIAGNACISQAWMRVKQKFDLLYSRRAFVHWYVAEGMEESDFELACTMVEELKEDYREIAQELEQSNNDQSNVTKLRGSALRRQNSLKTDKAKVEASAGTIYELDNNRSLNNAFDAGSFVSKPSSRRLQESAELHPKNKNQQPRRGALESLFGRNRSAAVLSSDGTVTSAEQTSVKPTSESEKPQPELLSNQETLFAEAMQLLSSLNLQRLIYSIADKRKLLPTENSCPPAQVSVSGDSSNTTVSKDAVSPLGNSDSVSSHFDGPEKISRAVGTDVSETSVTSNTCNSDYAMIEIISNNNNSAANSKVFPPDPRSALIPETEEIPVPSPRLSRLRGLLSSTGDISNSPAPSPLPVFRNVSRLSCSVTENICYVPLIEPPSVARKESVESLFEEENAHVKLTPRLPRKWRPVADNMHQQLQADQLQHQQHKQQDQHLHQQHQQLLQKQLELLDQHQQLQQLHKQLHHRPQWLQQHHIQILQKLQEQQLQLQKLQELQLQHSERCRKVSQQKMKLKREGVKTATCSCLPTRWSHSEKEG